MTEQQRYNGINASPGIAIGPVVKFTRERIVVTERNIEPEDVPNEYNRLDTALRRTHRDLQSIQQMISNRIGENYAELVEAQIMSLNDESVIREVKDRIKERLENAEYAFQQVLTAYREQLELADNVYIRDRASDIYDVKQRVLRHLMTRDGGLLENVDKPAILVTREMNPSDMIMLDKSKVIGLVSESGGRTSHLSILARAMQIPAVVGVENIVDKIGKDDTVIADGYHGTVFINPDQETTEQFRGELEHIKEFEENLYTRKDLPAETSDGYRIILSSNIGLPGELENVLKAGSEGIGLYRTEYLYLVKNTFPTEEEQFKEYRQIAEEVAPDPVIFRSFDLGGDKISASMEMEGLKESNPFLGYRAIRICLDNPGLFKTQLRAIYRAGAYGNIKLMFPMISALEEIIKVKEYINEVHEELNAAGVDYNPDIDLGALIEIPSAALIADALAEELDFFSIGTNDLIQYALAVDRGNDRVSFLYKSLHPSVLKLIKMTLEAGHSHDIWVGMCGEMAADPLVIPLLIGMGLDELSVSPVVLPKIKEIVRGLEFEKCRHLAETVLDFGTEADIERYLRQFIQEHLPEQINI
ncbi:MAG: phosphoenolpyruvate--protein phosphotransferase [Candidatus Marinimicrobia bacterium]|nr:phosphoenolpyruvate--protein phosphotransferase [Candidatus Neomarinimicrobiota bacterium]MCF7830095.1 phosphoenolpyruvate--protein phosphotransferase [Candidatus Neomarinimicrobiota bacterium]MCF7882142.1 phosphoenolpyruvate--protein phosphotransferase [Candidatus Neomarinimicrobiota bacterium]